MKEIVFYGILKKLDKEPRFLEVSSWFEVCQYLQANVPIYRKFRKLMKKKLTGCFFVIDGKTIEADNLEHAFKNAKKIEVIPVVALADPVSIVIFVVKVIIMIAISMAVSYLMAKMMGQDDPKNVKTASYILKGKVNTAARNTPVPLGYGMLRIAPPVVNVTQYTFDTTSATT